ncbi:MAG: ABC transporter permease, partial [Candidatus Acidiferrum sp.]
MNLIATLWQSLRYTLRVLARNPGFTAVALLSLALGIGANTAIFTLINALLLRDLPVHQRDRLVQLSAVRQGNKIPFSYPMFREVERGQRVFTGLIAWDNGWLNNVEVDGVLTQNRVLAITGNAYSELGTTPLLGRLLTPQDSTLGNGTNNQVAVISYEFWQRRLGGAANVIGRQIRVEGYPFTIIGVTRKWFTGMAPGEPPEVTVPVTAAPRVQSGPFSLDSRSLLWLHPVGRLKDGVTIEQARAQLQSFWPDVLLDTASTQTPGLRRQTFLSMGMDVSSAARGFSGGLRSYFARPLYVLAGIVGLILLVACVNLANLMLARAAARSQEMSVRVAIGASRWSLARQVLTESLVLSLAGALLGLVFAFWGSRLLVALMTQGSLLPVTLNLSPDLRVLSLTASMAILTGILFGLIPAWRSSREDPASVLQQNARSMSGGAGKLSKALIIAQVALSLVLLLGAGLFVRSFERLRAIDFGFNQSRMLEVALNPRPGGYDNLDMSNYHKQLLSRIAAIPGVLAVAFSHDPIPGSSAWQETISASSSDPSTGPHFLGDGMVVSPSFFQTLGIPLLDGRDFDGSADPKQPRTAILSRSIATRLFPNGDAIGKYIRFGFMPDYQNVQIIGVADNARVIDLRDAAPPVVYFSYLQDSQQWGDLLARTSVPPEALAKTIPREIGLLGHEYALETRTLQQVTDQELVEERVTALLSGFFAVLALLLASIGLYGLMSYAVTRRTREIGIRVAVGAQRQNVLWLVLRETLTLALLGIAIGIPSALAASRLIASMLFGLSPSDLPTIAAVSLLLLLVALLAGYLPARRASSIDPIVALRT